MDLKLRIFLIILLVIGILAIIKTIKKQKLSMKYGMYWTLVFLIMLIFVVFPNIIEYLAKFCGFKEAPNMLFLIGIFVLFYIVFRIFISLSKLQEINRSLVQELSLMQYENMKK